MHPTALNNITKFVNKYLSRPGLEVIDIGGADINGNLRNLFAEHNYRTLDIRQAEGVDIVVEAHNKYPINTSSIDVVVSTSMFEHDQAFWVTFNEMVRITKPRGYIYICTPSRGSYHWDRDCWRFLADAYPALAKWNTDVALIEYYIDESGYWGDNVGIFQKTDQNDQYIEINAN